MDMVSSIHAAQDAKTPEGAAKKSSIFWPPPLAFLQELPDKAAL